MLKRLIYVQRLSLYSDQINIRIIDICMQIIKYIRICSFCSINFEHRYDQRKLLIQLQTEKRHLQVPRNGFAEFRKDKCLHLESCRQRSKLQCDLHLSSGRFSDFSSGAREKYSNLPLHSCFRTLNYFGYLNALSFSFVKSSSFVYACRV